MAFKLNRGGETVNDGETKPLSRDEIERGLKASAVALRPRSDGSVLRGYGTGNRNYGVG
jgi:hypothetical protein